MGKQDTGKNIGTLIEQARTELGKLTGLKVSSTVGATKDEKGWRIAVELLEKESIPNSMDVLALYEALLDEEGSLLSLERKGMRKRMDTSGT